jgi:peptide/nickel transport system substrate-binding protein
MADRVGQHFGNYRLIALLGQGGFAEVYLGQHVRLELQAAIKVLHTHLTSQEAAHFYQEAQTIAKLTYPSIVRVFDYDVQDGVPFLVMDYAPNGSLRLRYPKGSVVPLAQLISSVKQVAAALQYAHEQKFIHRDVKPENMLVGRQQEVLLSDFGLAALAHSSASLSTQEAIGTLAYMAPEQIEGHPRAASDQYALGVVIYEWLCGERPFEGSVSEVMVQQLTMPPPPLRERVPALPAEVEQVVLRALAKESKARFASVATFAQALERASQLAPAPTVLLAGEQPAPGAAAAPSYATVAVPAQQPNTPTKATPSADLPVGALEPTLFPGSSPPTDLAKPQSQAVDEALPLRQSLEPTVMATPSSAVVPAPLEPTMPARQRARRLPRISAGLLISLVVMVIAAGILGSLSLLAHFGVLGARSSATTPTAVRGGTWTDDFFGNPFSLIPNGAPDTFSAMIDQALYLPLFYGDAQGMVHAGATTEIPTVQNGGISAEFKTWTFHLRPHLVWSDGQPYDARDVDYTWQLWRNPKFGAYTTQGFNLITSAEVSADYLSITFHLKQVYAPFLSLWVDGLFAPLPAHHFRQVAPEAILKSPEKLNPTVTSGPFMMAESLPGDHYTLVRNPRYYRAREGLPYLDKIVFRSVADQDAILQDLQAGTIDSSWFLDVSKVQAYQRLSHYTLVMPPTNGNFEAMYFNFHNTVLASHREVRQAIAMAIDHQALIEVARHGFATPLCTDHGSAYHPGYEPGADCPVFAPAAANQLLDDHGWMKGADGVRARGGQRLEFEYSTTAKVLWRIDGETILQHNLQAIGIKLDIQNYPKSMFFGSLFSGWNASPPTGAMAGRYDIAEFENTFWYDPDDSWILACNQLAPKGQNFGFYCNPALDALYKQEQTTVDPGLRQQIFQQIHQIYMTEFPFIVLYSPPDIAMVREGTHNYQPGALGAQETINIWEWWCDKGKC